uniref:Ribosome receptor lysine/proline rich domain-containing protein n=1 Tax=Periophthalmus magnuspinnatus TaxID=409849 RepID=A0A3B4ABQ7_9GOBI
MAVDIYDSQYLLILAPSLVIALMFLFFWLFMKETSYDEVLAKQKRDLKLPAAKPDTRKKTDKKKSKKKESATVGGGGGGGGGESEEDVRDFEVADVSNSSPLEMEEEPIIQPTPSPVPAAYAPPVSAEPPGGLRERKKNKKNKNAAATTMTPAIIEEPEVNGTKQVSIKAEAPVSESKQPTPPSPHIQAEVQVLVQSASPVQAQQTPPPSSGKKKKKQKAEPEAKPEQAPVSAKKEAPVVAETKAVDGAPPPSTGGKKKNAKKQKTEPVEEPLADSPVPTNHQATNNDNVPPPKSSGKKPKNETDKENTGVKLKELLSGLSGLALSDAEVVSVLSLLGEKSPNALNAWHKTAARPDPAEQERERLFNTLQEEASIAKDKVKQLSQELQVEKQKTGRVEAMMREQRAAMEKELGGMQAKAQGSYQELQTMQIKFQQVREQLESQISRLQQENGILRDAVSSATNQMESKNSAELNKLRSEYASMRNELAENKSKLQQEEHQRVSLEVSYKQNVSQLEVHAKRRWEELQNFLHSVSSDREKLQLLAVETEMNNKNKEIQTLHSSLTEAMVSKEGLEQKVMGLLEASQHSTADDSMQARIQDLVNENKNLQVQNEMLQAQISSQANHVSHIEELQKLLADKELQRKSLEDNLNAERSSGASRETDMQALHNENMTLKAQLQNLQAQISEQVSAQLLLSFHMKTVEGLLEKGLIEVANKEEELKKKNNNQTFCFRLSVKEQQISDLQGQLVELRDLVELHRRKNNELREKNWSAMEALSATESMLHGKLSKSVKEKEEALALSQAECRDVLHRLLPHVPLPSEKNHQEWLCKFEKAVSEVPAAQPTPVSGDYEELTDKLKEAEESQKILQKDCETYKKVLAETEGILQRLQSSVEQEESRWKQKLEVSQGELKEMTQKATELEQEIERLTDGGDLENLRREKQHLESELERAERESATYVTEVRELKTQLTETLSKLETEETERQRVAANLYKAQQSVDLIQGELSKVSENADELIENSTLSSQNEETERKEKMTAGLNQTVSELQLLLQAVSQQLTKGPEGVCFSSLLDSIALV